MTVEDEVAELLGAHTCTPRSAADLHVCVPCTFGPAVAERLREARRETNSLRFVTPRLPGGENDLSRSV